MDYKNKCILITGGSRGIGRATAIAFAERGARVAITYHTRKDAAMETLNMLPGNVHIARQTVMDDPESIRVLINQVAIEFGRIDVVVNNAGIYVDHALDQVNYEDWQIAWTQTLAINLQGPANLCYCAAQYMKMQGGGKIINVSSRGAYRGEPDHPAYAASKAALNALTQSLAKKLGSHNILVSAVAPGFVSTDMARPILNGPEGQSIRQQSPLGRVARPEEVANAILFLASEKSDFMTGAILDINGASYFR